MKKMTIVLAAAIGVSTLFAEGVFKAGFSRQDVTPPLGTPLAGYYHYRPMTGILDPLEAICIALSEVAGGAPEKLVSASAISRDIPTDRTATMPMDHHGERRVASLIISLRTRRKKLSRKVDGAAAPRVRVSGAVTAVMTAP
jgi:hypothetical protein